MWSNWTIRWLVRTKNYTLASSFWGFENNHELLLLTDMWLASHKCMKTKPGFYPIQTYLNETFHHQFEITLPSNVWKCCWVWYKFALAYCMGEWKLLLVYYRQKKIILFIYWSKLYLILWYWWMKTPPSVLTAENHWSIKNKIIYFGPTLFLILWYCTSP